MHRIVVTVVTLVALAAMSLGSIAAVRAAPPQTQPATANTAAAVREFNKMVLKETSVDGPGFFGFVDNPGTVIAWAGTDPVHRLNVMTSNDGVHYAHKIILHEASVNRPAVVRMSQAAGGVVILAWRGTDANHSLNVLFDVYGRQKKLVLRDNSFTTPSIVIFRGDLLLAWTGTDANHSLNVLPISLASLTPGHKTILSQFSSDAGPNLNQLRTSTERVVLSWSIRGTSQLNLAESSDGVHFTSALGSSGSLQKSPSAPDFLHYTTEAGPEYWIAWTGTDTIHHLNVQWTTHYPQWPDAAHTKSVLNEAAFGGPAAEFNTGFGLFLAWTGTDTAHHLNVAQFEFA